MIYGYGNPGRQDDGLGVFLADQLEEIAPKKGLKSMNFDSNYQLNIEDALTISKYDMVVFADASMEEIQDFSLSRVRPNHKIEFTMHSTSPEFILYLCQSLYNKYPLTFLIHIKGYEFDFMEPITESAKENLEKSIRFLIDSFSKSSMPVDLFDQFIIECNNNLKSVYHESGNNINGFKA